MDILFNTCFAGTDKICWLIWFIFRIAIISFKLKLSVTSQKNVSKKGEFERSIFKTIIMAQYCTINKESSNLSVVAVAMAETVSMAVVATMVSIAVAKVVSNSITVTVSVSMGVSVSIVGVSLSLSLGRPLAPGHGSEGASGQTVGVVVAVEARVDVVVVDSNAVAVVAVEGLGAPLAVVVADETVKTLGRPVAEGGGDTGVDSDAMAVGKAVSVSKTVSIAVVSIGIGISIGTPLSIGIRTGSIDGGLAAVANSGGPGGGDAAGADEGVAVAVEGIGVGHGGRGQAGGDLRKEEIFSFECGLLSFFVLYGLDF